MIGTFIIMALVGVVIGLLSGLIGVGGGTIMVPICRLVLGMAPVQATGTSLFTIIPTSLSGAVSHIREKTCVPKLGIALGIGGACTSPVGVWLAHISPGWAVMGATAIVIGYSAYTMLKKALSHKGAEAERGRANLEGKRDQSNLAHEGDPQKASDHESPSALDVETGHTGRIGGGSATYTPEFTPAELMKGVAIGLVTGVASGYVGLGGGFLMVPLMVSLLRFPMKLASGTSLVAIMIIAIPGTIAQCALGNVDFLVGIAVACGSIPGAALGARLTKYVSERMLQFAFASFLAVAAILMVVKEVGLL